MQAQNPRDCEKRKAGACLDLVGVCWDNSTKLQNASPGKAVRDHLIQPPHCTDGEMAPQHTALDHGLVTPLPDSWTALASSLGSWQPFLSLLLFGLHCEPEGPFKKMNLIRSHVLSEPSAYFLPHFEPKSSAPPIISFLISSQTFPPLPFPRSFCSSYTLAVPLTHLLPPTQPLFLLLP